VSIRLVVARPRPPYAGRRFSQFALGDRFGDDVLVTERHLADGAALIGDYNPLHVDPEFAARSRFGGTILHGVLTSAMMSAPFGNLVAGTAIAYLGQDTRFLAPVRAGDTLRITWTVVQLVPKPAHAGGLVVGECEARNQRDEVVATARGTMLVGEGG
jgi:phosphate acetyltransferase/phosphate butyryltransferase